MILASRQPNGKVKYFSALTGMEYKLGRETGRHLGFIPDDVFRFLYPKIESKQGFGNLPSTASRSGSGALINAPKPEREGWFAKFIAWFKSLFNGNK